MNAFTWNVCGETHHGLKSSECCHLLGAYLYTSRCTAFFFLILSFLPTRLIIATSSTNCSILRLSGRILQVACELFLKPGLLFLVALLSSGPLISCSCSVYALPCSCDSPRASLFVVGMSASCCRVLASKLQFPIQASW